MGELEQKKFSDELAALADREMLPDFIKWLKASTTDQIAEALAGIDIDRILRSLGTNVVLAYQTGSLWPNDDLSAKLIFLEQKLKDFMPSRYRRRTKSAGTAMHF